MGPTLEAGFEPGLVIRRRRRDAGYSQAQLAAMIGTSEAAVGRWERNEVEPPSRHADELASALGIDPVELRPPGVYVREVAPAPELGYQSAAERGEGLYTVPVHGHRSRWPTQYSTTAFLYDSVASGDVRVVESPRDIDELTIGDERAPHLRAAVRGFFANGGTLSYLVPVAGNDPGEALRRLDQLGTVTIVCFPDLMALDGDDARSPADALEVQRLLVRHCEAAHDRIAVLDAPPGMHPEEVSEWRRDHAMFDSKAAALYWPWLRRFDEDWQLRAVPPSGHVAGILARVEALSGAHKPLANEVIRDTDGPAFRAGPGDRAILNPWGINCLVTGPSGDTRIFGDRTLSADPSWRFLHTARLASMVVYGIRSGTSWVVDEAGTGPQLWAQLAHDVERFLEILWRAGAIHGVTKEEAYFVRCDATTNGIDPTNRAVVALDALVLLSPWHEYHLQVRYRRAAVA